MTKAKLYKLGNTIISLVIVIIAMTYLYHIFSEKINVEGLLDAMNEIINYPGTLLFIVILSIINWGLEFVKWKILISKVQELSNRELIQSIFLGVTMALVTPNRIGELGGRLRYIKKGNRTKAIYYHSFSAITQLSITIIVGLFGIVYFSHFIKSLSFLQIPFKWIFPIMMSTLIVFFYFFSNSLRKTIQYFSARINTLQTIPKITQIDRFYIFFLSLLRYVVFSVQFGLLFQLLAMDFKWIDCLMGLSVIFLTTTLIPAGWISDLPVRTSSSFYFFEQLGYQGIDAIVCALLLWVVNLLIPGLLGLAGVRNINWLRKDKI